MAFIPSPFADFPEASLTLPERWRGKHATRYYEAVTAAQAAGLVGRVMEFSVALALLDDWRLPGLEGPPERWDFQELPLELIHWVAGTVLDSYNATRIIPKNSSPPSQDGSAMGMNQPGS